MTVVESSMWSPGEVEPAHTGLEPGWTTVFTRGITSTASSSLSVVGTVCSGGGDAVALWEDVFVPSADQLGKLGVLVLRL
ncbi:hypothetical protein E2C01_082359 [Portunus trituberculatus]|uniref:Uncharacterized protein n=1 Tax=Portunus trituberculatus TaxID=210409 RepID=A0A5B7J1F0_PORTR|nr:hypothetical protein [Portunus trituberculatus]